MRQIRQQISSPLYQNSLFLMANTLVASGLGFFFWMVVARFYTKAEVGLGAAIISAISFLAFLGTLGLGIALVRFLPKAQKPVDMINSCLTLGGIVSLAVAAIFICGLDLWSPALGFIKQNAIFAIAFTVFTMLWTFSKLMDYIFIAERRTEFVLSTTAIFSLLKLPLPVLLVIFFHSFGIVSSWGIAIGVAIAISLFLFLPRVENHYRPVPKLDLGIIKNIWEYSVGNYFASLLSVAPNLVLPIMVVNLLGPIQNAYFYVAWMIALIVFAIPEAVSRSLFAEGSHFEDKLRVNVRKSLAFVYLLLVPVVILLLLVGKWLLLLFGAGYSENALTLLRILSVSSLLIGLNEVYMSILRVLGRLKELAIICGFIAVAVLVGSYLITPATGITGIGYTWIGAQGVVSVYVLLAVGMSYRTKSIPGREDRSYGKPFLQR